MFLNTLSGTEDFVRRQLMMLGFFVLMTELNFRMRRHMDIVS